MTKFKVKDGIDFKELEKYGYEYENGRYIKYTNDTYYGSSISIIIGYYSKTSISKHYDWVYMFSPIIHSPIMRKGKLVTVDKKYVQDLIDVGLVEEIRKEVNKNGCV